jgi:hypothetical protein
MFPRCPVCDCGSLVAGGEHVFCVQCDWNSIEAGFRTPVDDLLDAAMKVDWDLPLVKRTTIGTPTVAGDGDGAAASVNGAEEAGDGCAEALASNW